MSNISRAQLTRYLGGAPIPSDKLQSLASALGVTASWLLCDESASRESVSSALIRARQLSERLLRLLQRYDIDRALLPSEIARVMEIIALSQHYTVQTHEEDPYTDYDLEKGVDFLSAMRKNDWLDVYVDGCHHYAKHGPAAMQPTWAGKWAKIIQEAMTHHFSKEPMVTDYFIRLNIPIWDAHLKVMQQWLKFLCEKFPKGSISLLDLGCGNGRHMVYLHNASDRFALTGIDTSTPAIELCHQHVKAGRLPAGCIQQADFFNISYPDASFDCCMSVANLQFLPLVPGSLDVGVGRALFEASRILKPGGYMLILTRALTPDEFFPNFQASHTPELLQQMFAQTGFQVISQDPIQLKELGLPGSRFGRGLSHQDIWTLQKS